MRKSWSGAYVEHWPDYDCLAIWVGDNFIGTAQSPERAWALIKEISKGGVLPEAPSRAVVYPKATEEEKRAAIATWLEKNDPRESTRRLKALRAEAEGRPLPERKSPSEGKELRAATVTFDELAALMEGI